MMERAIHEVLKFNQERDWHQFHTPENIAKSIAIEAGELLECFQWDAQNFDRQHVLEELGDVLNYCILMADLLNVDMEQVALDKLVLNKQKYPVEQCLEKNKKKK